jgi:hypothetical protein
MVSFFYANCNLFLFFFCGTGGCTQGIKLATKMLCYVTHTSSPLCWLLLQCFVMLCLDSHAPWASYLCFPCSWNERCAPYLAMGWHRTLQSLCPDGLKSCSSWTSPPETWELQAWAIMSILTNFLLNKNKTRK